MLAPLSVLLQLPEAVAGRSMKVQLETAGFPVVARNWRYHNLAGVLWLLWHILKISADQDSVAIGKIRRARIKPFDAENLFGLVG
jgi:hypothetical protein